MIPADDQADRIAKAIIRDADDMLRYLRPKQLRPGMSRATFIAGLVQRAHRLAAVERGGYD